MKLQELVVDFLLQNTQPRVAEFIKSRITDEIIPSSLQRGGYNFDVVMIAPVMRLLSGTCGSPGKIRLFVI